MKMAIDKAMEGVQKAQTPFGCCIVRDGEVLSCAHNAVWLESDITAHAEIHAIRLACQKLKNIDLSGAFLYSTCEPCPMCFSACHWARIDTLYYGTSIQDAKAIGFNELEISTSQLKQFGRSQVSIVGGFMRDECMEIFTCWFNQNNKRIY